MKRIMLLFILISLVTYTKGQEHMTYSQRLYLAYIEDEMDQWEEIISEMNQEYELTSNQALLYELCFAYYGYIGYLISEEKDKMAKQVLKKAMNKMDVLEANLNGRHDVLALRGAMLGYRIILSKFTSMFLGPKALRYINTAYESASTCFNCNTEMGNMKFYTPKFLGGSKTEAVQYYEQGVALLENSKLKTDRDWIYMNTVLLLANAYKETGQEEKACQLYKQLLEYEPEADWIRKDLYSKCPVQ